MVKIYKRKDIDEGKRSFLKNISSQKYCDDYLGNINSVNDLANLHDIRNLNDECLAIDTDWLFMTRFLCYIARLDFQR